ncbi:uncharacterized protein KY384_003735 [Bacidia gigantensis]|uniref:uncharacterized protein n=1 Tax=Bacidia gigantensis TaxID=2732470 RepID=UPI001D05BEA9|nr:uncharacterized protein KY384_003735 [Bacidia gigantensis]KAG8532098.1 hypothetical protein KY384_003735 [Bacidia gigantensis]
MEERKRPATHDHDDTLPPHKKQATSVNGGSKGHVDADMPWKDDLERFQKEAIWRQMQEHKRERNAIEARLNSAEKRAQYHDEHIMIIDGWFSELLDEVKLLVGDSENHKIFTPFPSVLLDSDSEAFKAHLKARSSDISSAVSKLFAHRSNASPEVSELHGRLAQLLATEKSHIIELENSRHEKKKLEGRLEDAVLRYMLAEKKLDRSKSATVAKLEKQAISGGRSESGSGLGGGRDVSGNDQKENGPSSEDVAAAETARKEALAESEKRKEQIATLEAENEKLSVEVTSLTNRLTGLSDEDYSKTDLFKQLKSQHEDVIKRINDLEATNIQLREEATRLQAERTAYRTQVEQESASVISERERQLAQAENDLARIRTSRDELTADITIRKAAQGQERASLDQIKEMASAKDERIKALESEVARLQLQIGQVSAPASPPASLDGVAPDEMQNKFANLEKQYSLLNTELQSMGTAFSKANKLASQKISNLHSLEEKAQRLAAEKSKADQKYFSAMKAKEAREQEVRTLRTQNAKSSEIVTSIKETEAANRALQVVTEKQVTEIKESFLNVQAKLRLEQHALTQKSAQMEGLRSEIEGLKKNVATKDEVTIAKSSACRKAEVEIEGLNVRLDETKRSLESWRSKGLGSQSGEYEMLRTLAICTVCRINFKNTAIKTCGHVFCKDCVEERTTSRSRKCPNCNRSFGTGDVMRITL